MPDPEDSERTPLLANSPVAPTAGQVTAQAIIDENEEQRTVNRHSSSRRNDDKPLDKTQMILLCYARVVEPIAFFSIFPFINQMVQKNGNLADSDVGFYSGLIESLFSLTQMCVMIFWGRMADRLGRKPVLVFSLAGVAIATSTFGLARTIWQMIALRCLAGVFAGTIVTIRTMITEHSTAKTQARAFSWFAFSGNVGIFIGPLIGGALAEPATQYPGVFGKVQFFRDYPYALPTIATGAIGASAAVISALFIKETMTFHKGNADDDDDGAESATSRPKPSNSIYDLLKAPGVAMVLYLYGHTMLLAFAYTAVVPVFWFTPVRLGGYGFTALQISLFMGLTGFSQAIWLLFIFPPLQHKFGTGGVLRTCAKVWPFLFIFSPLLNLLLRQETDAARTAFWVIALVCNPIGVGVSMAFTAIQLALNDISPDPALLGTLNAVALAIASGVRAFSPALFTSLFAIGVRGQILWGYLIWVVMVGIAVTYGVATLWLPEKAEGKVSDSNDDDDHHDD